MHPDRVVVGADEGSEWAADAIAAAYEPLGGELVRTDVASAEMIKLASNAFLATKISFINEIANVSEEVGADVTEVARGMGLDERIGPSFLRAGIGYGGSCFPKDVSALKQLAGNSGYHFQLLNSVIEVNELQKRRVIGKLEKHLGSLVGKRIALLGLAFKPDTDDMREASSLVLSARLQGEGAAVIAFDPVAERAARGLLPSVEFSASAEEALAGADAAILVTEWPQFAELDWARLAGEMANPVLIDGRNFLDPEALRDRRLHLRGHRSVVQALVLVGGEGTRLRPLTRTAPKPVIPLVDRPFIRYMIDWLARHGVDEVVLSIGFLAHGIRDGLGDEIPGGPRLRYVEEPDRRGTAGAIKYAERYLDERFLALNGDVLTDLDLSALIARHEESDAKATLALYPVEDPSAYGLVRRREDGEITEFLEKPDPAEIDTDEISAGAYVLERSVLDMVPEGQEFSIEREVFPKLVGNGLYSQRLEGYWMDIGTPERYLQASWDILEGRVETEPGAKVDERHVFVAPDAEVDPGADVGGSVFAEPGTRIESGARVGPRAVLGPGCEIREGALVIRVGPAPQLRARSRGAGERLDPRPERPRRRPRRRRARLRDRAGRGDRPRGHRPGRQPDRAGGGVRMSDVVESDQGRRPDRAARRGPRPSRAPARRALALRRGRPRPGRLPGPGRLRNGRLGDRRRPRPGCVRRSPDAADGDRPRLRPVLCHAARPRRLLLQLLGQHRGDASPATPPPRRSGRPGSPRRPAARSPSPRGPTGSP